jgi:hypothetical protein
MSDQSELNFLNESQDSYNYDLGTRYDFSDILKDYDPTKDFDDDTGGNLEQDFTVVHERDRPAFIEDMAGNTGYFSNTGDWVPVDDTGAAPTGMGGWNAPADWLRRIWKGIKDTGSKALTGGTTQNAGLLALLGALAGYADRRTPSGGGVAMRYAGVKNPTTRTMVKGPSGQPIARYAADGGLMRAYARGGEVVMQDGGFVMTKKAVDGAGGIQGLKQLLPAAQPIRGPGTGTSDSIPARIQGPDGASPARVSNGEAYVPPGEASTQRLYALMRQLERKA